jgi:uncharacterized LabA/DUF88 family protein
MVQRTALLVDAGWLLAASALRVLGTPERDDLACDYASLLEALGEYVDTHSDGMRRVRTYWYDAAPGGMATVDHKRIAGLPYVKVRLGRQTKGGQQKGVDLLMWSDLIDLARERAISRAYLLSGDEDLREGVAEAQRLGVQVVLLGMRISAEHDRSESARLVRECDEFVTLPDELPWTHVGRREPGDAQESDHPELVQARRIGEAVAREWLAQAPRDRARAVLAGFPHFPKDVDMKLLSAAEEQLGSLRGRTDLKTELRGHFRSAFTEAIQAADALATEGS